MSGEQQTGALGLKSPWFTLEGTEPLCRKVISLYAFPVKHYDRNITVITQEGHKKQAALTGNTKPVTVLKI